MNSDQSIFEKDWISHRAQMKRRKKQKRLHHIYCCVQLSVFFFNSKGNFRSTWLSFFDNSNYFYYSCATALQEGSRALCQNAANLLFHKNIDQSEISTLYIYLFSFLSEGHINRKTNSNLNALNALSHAGEAAEDSRFDKNGFSWFIM